jgi:LPS sulfotransferase NodH
MRRDHDEHSSILDDLLQVAHGDQVARELDVGEVTVVHVRRVDDLCELLAVDLCGVRQGRNIKTSPEWNEKDIHQLPEPQKPLSLSRKSM